jgi:hypothetical protein
MKNLPNNHTPKEDSWEKILGKMSFESQLERHIPNLPMFEPTESSWADIDEKLKKKITFWPNFGLAAALIGGLLIATIIFNSEKEIPRNTSVGNDLTSIGDLELSIGSLNPEKESVAKTTLAESEIINEEKFQNQIEEIPLISIEVPDLEFIAFESELIIPEKMNPAIDSVVQADSKTYHKVAISWGLKQKNFQVKTPFGKQDPDSIRTVQTGSISKSKRIRIGQKN